MTKHPKEARYFLPIFYEYINNELPKICKEEGLDYEEESKKVLQAAMQFGDAFWDKLDLGLKLLQARFPK